jgi:hypothetical protein
MINDTIGKIEGRIRKAESIKPEAKEELLRLLSTLQQEVTSLEHTHGEAADSITGFADVSTHQATRESRNNKLLELSLQGFSSSVGGFESSHPRLVHLVNRICETLSSLGV